MKALIEAITKMSKKGWGFVVNLWLVKFPTSPISVILGQNSKGCFGQSLSFAAT